MCKARTASSVYSSATSTLTNAAFDTIPDDKKLIAQYLTELGEDSATRSIVLTGNDKSFAAGGDIKDAKVLGDILAKFGIRVENAANGVYLPPRAILRNAALDAWTEALRLRGAAKRRCSSPCHSTDCTRRLSTIQASSATPDS